MNKKLIDKHLSLKFEEKLNEKVAGNLWLELKWNPRGYIAQQLLWTLKNNLVVQLGWMIKDRIGDKIKIEIERRLDEATNHQSII
jgi:hypothetical protein